MDMLILKVVDILPETHDTITILLERTDGQPLQYQAGQFLTFLLYINGRELRRSYSLSSTPGVDPTPSVTVKRVINGEASRYLQDHLRTGDLLRSLPPAGRFTLETPPILQEGFTRNPEAESPIIRQWLIFIAAGSGMVPILPLLRTALMQGRAGQIILLTQHHNEQSILFKSQLEGLQKEYGHLFKWISLLSADEESVKASIMVRKMGRLNNWLLEELLEELLLTLSPGDRQHVLFYLCGPQAFMRMVQFTLKLLGFANAQIKRENFTVEFVPPPPLLSDSNPKKVTIHAQDRIYRYEVSWPKTILQAGLDHHIPLPYSCQGGRCSSCVAKCLSGTVKMTINEVLTEKDLQDGLVLTCVGYAITDLELEY